MHIVRKSSFTSAPWKNGGGITHEVLRVPAYGEFRWRVSVAEIDASGPFSDFADYNRTMVLLRGDGLSLIFAGVPSTDLRAIGDLWQFDGALATDCRLLAGPCTDLNLIVSKSMGAVRAWVELLSEPRSFGPARRDTLLVFSLGGRLSVGLENGESAILDEWELCVLDRADSGTVGSAAADPPATPLVFFAALDDNSH